MAFIVANRVKETTTTTGGGAIALSGAVNASFITFASKMSVGDTCFATRTAVDAGGAPTGQWETGLYTYTAANQLTLTTLDDSSTGSAITWSAGTQYIFIDVPAVQVKWIQQETLGSFTPTIYGATVAGVNTYATQEGRYIKHGRLVHLLGRIVLSAKGGTMSGTVHIGGLPFSASSLSANTFSSMDLGYMNSVTAPSGGVSLVGIVAGSAIDLYWTKASGAPIQSVAADITSTTDISFSATYVTDV